MVAVNRESDSRLEFVDILYAGYDGVTKNTTSALFIQGVPPIMNGLRVERSARDGVQLYASAGPVLIANSTFSFNRGHGILVDNTTDGRVFINNSRIEGNWGDGIWYRQKRGVDLVTHGMRERRQIGVNLEDLPRIDMCSMHTVPNEQFFPHLIALNLKNRTFWDPTQPTSCWMTISLPPRLPYTYSIQWSHIRDRNTGSQSTIVICDSDNPSENRCAVPRYRVPIEDGVYPQSLSVKSSGKPLYIGLEHVLDGDQAGYVQGDVNLLFRIHASVLDKAYYGLNVTNCIIGNNSGNGIFATEIRDRTAISNVTLEANQGYAGFHVRDGAADIWINETRILRNWGDGINVSYAGGSIMINGTRIESNRWRGAAVHFNQTIPFYPMYQEVIFKGRPSNNPFYLPTIVSGNEWGGILVGNYCAPAEPLNRPRIDPKVLINWVELTHNSYHPSLEIFSCRELGARRTIIDVTGNRIEGNRGFGMRIAPAVNLHAVISSNQFLHNNDTALFIRNAQWPELADRPSNVTVSKNAFKFNTAKYIVSLGLNENAAEQSLVFNQQNELRANTVFDPFPGLSPRSSPFAALVVSSSNVRIHRNCFKNERARYEIATELEEHAKQIDARENNWGSPIAAQFLDKIFDQFNRYSLAAIRIDPYMAVCNQRVPHITPQNEVFRQFRKDNNQLGGIIYENHDLLKGTYTITDDLQVVPGAKLTIASGSVLQFANGVGMLIQGELTRNEFENDEKVVFTAAPFILPKRQNIRLVDADGNDGVTEGRLEVLVDNQWGTICNRSWTADLTILACNQLGLIADVQYFENWRVFPPAGDLPMVMDNIRCEENEVDLTRCRHDGMSRNCGAGCRPSEVVGLRCLEPRWAGVRYSLLANPPTVTGQTTMENWLIEKGGLFNFRTSQFCAAFQLDWNYHTFNRLEIRNNFWDGVDVVYNDLIKKPAIRASVITNNRRNGMKIRSAGITIENVTINYSGQSGIRYNPSISSLHQTDIVSWLSLREQPELEANNIFHIPNRNLDLIEVLESSLNQRKFLVAVENEDCPRDPTETCVYNLMIRSSGYEYGMSAKMAIQIVNPASNVSDEDAVFTEVSTGKSWSARRDQINFPVVSTRNEMRMRYTRSFGAPKLVVLILFLDNQEYVDRFVHVYQSRLEDNQYAFSSVHYSNLSFADGRLANRWNNEKIWLQKVNFTRNTESVIWTQSNQHAVVPGTPLAEVTYHVDNCSIVDNTGPIVESHRDLYASANIFHWIFWSNTFANNSRSGLAVALPDTYDLVAKQHHSFWLTENRFENNSEFRILVNGYYTFANISSNNFTNNWAPAGFGIFEMRGMEKELVCERNRFFDNWGHWMIKIDSTSHYLRSLHVPSTIQYNYLENNRFLKPRDDYVDMWPRSYSIGVFGSQRAQIHFNRLKNSLIDFELVSGCQYAEIDDTMNVTHNWWGTGNEAEIAQRIFDFDDWNTMMLTEWSPFYVTNDLFINFWWNPWKNGQLANATYSEPTVFDLKGRVYESKNMSLIMERWYEFPHYYRPFRPYRISRDVTIMPGATLHIQPGVEVHVWPNVRILVLGNLIADGTYWQPIRFKPINTTEYDEIRGRIPSEFRRKRSFTIDRSRADPVYRSFPTLHRQDPFYQRFDVSLTHNGSEDGRAGFLEIYNATTGELVPSCDRQFTIRNAQVVCRELGLDTMNVYHWLTPRWDYNPKLRILKTYMEPRECRGDETRLDRCNLRLSGNNSLWQCMDNEHFNYVYCGRNASLDKEYIGNWGGIAFADSRLERSAVLAGRDESILRNVEIVGGGAGHNNSWQSAGLQIFHRSPILDHVNVTNCSTNAVQIVSPNGQIVLSNLNVTHNQGKGISIVTTYVQSPNSNEQVMQRPLTIPYFTQGMLDMRAAVKQVLVKNRIMVYYKYDSFPVDCVKVFTALPGRRIAFRLIQHHLYASPTDLGRSDAIRLYNSASFVPMNLLATYPGSDPSKAISADTIALHLRATAADGEYGFIAEVSAMPSTPESHTVGEVVIRSSRLDFNDRGAIEYTNIGEISPVLVIEDSSIAYNGLHLYGNISTSTQAVRLNLHNTMFLLFRSNSLAYNRGGLMISGSSSSAVARLQAIIKNCLFAYNSNSTSVLLYGNNYQQVTLLNNVISHNYALYHDTIISMDVSLNMTRNTLFENVGLHTVNILPNTRISSDKNVFLKNHFYNNLALGTGHQYAEKFGYQPRQENDEFQRRPRRQIAIPILKQDGVSFDWWTHVNNDTSRYRATIVAGSSQEVFKENTFNDPRNDYEIATSPQTQFDLGVIDARLNYWGYPGTVGVASGKIRDHEDYPYLARVDYSPVLESNTSLVEGDCEAGWFQAGHQEFKSCFLLVAAAATYDRAVEYCERLDAFVPYLRADDVRQSQLAERIFATSMAMITDQERIAAYGVDNDVHVWISSVNVPSTQCAWLSSRNKRIGTMNCNLLLPFVCEKGTHPYFEPILWRTGIVVAVVLLAAVLICLLLLILCWWIKSRRRREEEHERKIVKRASMKLRKKHERQMRQLGASGASHESAHASLRSSSKLATTSAYSYFTKDATDSTYYSPTSGYGVLSSAATESGAYSEIDVTCSTCPTDSQRTSTISSYSDTSESTVQNCKIPSSRHFQAPQAPQAKPRRQFIETTM